MIKLHTSPKRVGRGISAGQGKTAGRGTKGQNSRAGKKRYRGFTSGSLAYAQRLPKFAGIKSSKRNFTVTTAQLEALKDRPESISRSWLKEKGFIPASASNEDTVKIVFSGAQTDSYNLAKDIKASRTVKIVR